MLLQAAFVVLEGGDGPAVGADGLHGLCRGGGGGGGGDHGDVEADGGGADAAFIGLPTGAGGGVDDEGDLAVGHEVNHVGACARGDFLELGGFHAVIAEVFGRSFGGVDAKAKRTQGAGGFDDGIAVGDSNGDEDAALGRVGGEPGARGHLAFGKGDGEGWVDAHDFAGAAHFGA